MKRPITRIDNDGYLVFTDSGSFVHRWVAEKKYGKEAVRGKVVHHIDRDKRNNDPNNLLLVSKDDHHYIHQYENKKDFLSTIIMALSIGFVGLVLIGKGASAGFLVCLIFICALELKTSWFTQAMKRPNEKAVMNKGKKK